MPDGEASGVPGSGDRGIVPGLEAEDASPVAGIRWGTFIVKNMKAWDGVGLADVGIADAADEPAIVEGPGC